MDYETKRRRQVPHWFMARILRAHARPPQDLGISTAIATVSAPEPQEYGRDYEVSQACGQATPK